MYVGSPSTLRCTNNSILASHDLFGTAFGRGVPRAAYAFRSDDNGTSWNAVGSVAHMYWATLFAREGDSTVYLMGVSSDNVYEPAQIVIAASSDCGTTWSNASYLTNDTVPYSTGPTPVVQHGGRLWRAYERNTGSWGSGYATLVVSALANTPDLLSPTSWVLSGATPFSSVADSVPANWSIPGVESSFGWLEGNAVVPPNTISVVDGGDAGSRSDTGTGIAIVLRVNSIPTANKAAYLFVSSPSAMPVFVRWLDFFPGGMSKFSIRQDASSGLYVTLSNMVVDASISGSPTCATTAHVHAGVSWSAGTNASLPCCGMQQVLECHSTPLDCWWCHASTRNNLTLSVSPDLVTWRVLSVLMTDDSGQPSWMSQLMTGFQYVDWQFDGKDLIAAVRAGYRGSQCYHNSNRLLFQRVVDWRRFL